MSVWWSIGKVKDYKSECYVGDAPNPVTDALILATMIVGLSRISQKNFKTFTRRINDYSNATGNRLLYRFEDHKSISYNPTLDQVRRHIGLATNASSLNAKEWKVKLGRIAAEAE